MAGPELSRRLSPMDALFYYLDREEEPQNIGMLAEFEGVITYDAFVETLSSRLHLAPRYRQCVVPVPMHIGLPTWEDDPEFNIAQHIVKHTLEPPGTQADFCDLGRRLFEGTLDRTKPLWEIHLVQGLEGGRTGMVTKIHHCMVDGVGGVGLLQVLFDITREAPPFPKVDYKPRPAAGTTGRIYEALWDSAIDNISQWSRLQRSLGHYAHDRSGADVFGAVKEFGRTLKQFIGPLTPMPFNQRFSGHRVLAVADASFAEARRLRTVSDGTINDVVLTVLTGAVRKYLAAHAGPKSAPELRILCPVNIRQSDRDGIHGNAITFLPMQVPLGDMPPTDRLRRITAITRRLKEARVAEAAAMVLGLVQTAPPLALHTLLTRLAKPGLQDFLGRLGAMPPANVLCTNVPGPQIPLYTCGQRLDRYYPLAPITMEIGLSCAVTSYDQRLFFTLIGDRHCIPDLPAFHACFLESYDELRHAAGVASHDYVPLQSVQNGATKQTRAVRTARA